MVYYICHKVIRGEFMRYWCFLNKCEHPLCPNFSTFTDLMQNQMNKMLALPSLPNSLSFQSFLHKVSSKLSHFTISFVWPKIRRARYLFWLCRWLWEWVSEGCGRGPWPSWNFLQVVVRMGVGRVWQGALALLEFEIHQ